MRRISHIFLCCLFFLAGGGALISLQAEIPAMSRQFTWPRDVSGWKLESEDRQFDRKTLFNHIDGAAELFLAYNFRHAWVHNYEKPGYPPITAEVYQMGSPEDAFGLFSFGQQDPEAGIGDGSEFGGGLLRLWKGKYFMSVFGEGEGPEVEAAVLALGKELASVVRESGKPPTILTYVPPDNRDGKSFFLRSHVLLNQRFFVAYQNILQIENDVEAVLTRYKAAGGRVHLVILRYPGEARARAAIAGFRKAYMPEASATGIARTENGKWTVTELWGPYVFVLFDAPGKDDGLALLREVRNRIEREAK
jgi:hypothetical protein